MRLAKGTATGGRFGGSLRRPPGEQTLATINKAIGYASYRALLGVYAPDAAWLRQQMSALRHDPDATFEHQLLAARLPSSLCWQPITFTPPDGTKFTPGSLTPHWRRVKPFVLESAAQLLADPVPVTSPNDALLRE